ncbi:hypothetical protein TCAL_12891 [Tigriopus californicus]|uniref:Uncharacterized protein n=1 Tax=Tigriopus californicus TaxID=6832 RepID=A0A553PPB9_TIGCA|nr:hypothetical protein TCAL_12891 [Tigriopus californicus]
MAYIETMETQIPGPFGIVQSQGQAPSKGRDLLNLQRVLDMVRLFGVKVAKLYNEEEKLTGADAFDANHLKRAWNNLKLRARKKKSDRVKELKRTGGGPPPKLKKLTPLEANVLDEAGDQTELVALFDSETQFDKTVNERMNNGQTQHRRHDSSASTAQLIAPFPRLSSTPNSQLHEQHHDQLQVLQLHPNSPSRQFEFHEEISSPEMSMGATNIIFSNNSPLQVHFKDDGFDDKQNNNMEYVVESEIEKDIDVASATVESHDNTISFDLSSGQRQILQQALSEDQIIVTPPPATPRSTSPNQEQRENPVRHQGQSGNRGQGRGRGKRRARAPSTLAGRFIENRAEMEGNFLSDQHKVKQEIVVIEKDAALMYKKAVEKKAENEERQYERQSRQDIQLFDIELKKAADLARLDVTIAKLRGEAKREVERIRGFLTGAADVMVCLLGDAAGCLNSKIDPGAP